MEKRYGGNGQALYEEVKSRGSMTVHELWHATTVKHPTVRFDEFLAELNDSTSRGLLSLQEPLIRNFQDYFKSWRYGCRGWLTAASVVTALLLIEFLNIGPPIGLIRWVAGTYMVLIAPGYTLTWALFPSRKKTSGLNRLALTIALSLFLVPATGLLFNYTPIGITAKPIATILGATSLLFLYVGMRREYTILGETTKTAR